MDSSEVNFKSDLTMSFRIDEEPKSVTLELSDSLYASEEELQASYKNEIAKFVNSSAIWYPLAIEKIRIKDTDPGGIRLMTVYVLTEQDADSMIFGLLFRVDIDVEHQRGLKIDGETLEILEYGIGDVAFC